MTGALLSLLLFAQTVPPPVILAGDAIDWATLPDLPYRQPPHVTEPMNSYVRGQTRARNCTVQRRVRDKVPAIRIEVAVLVHPEDGIRTAVPRAIGCPVVEQYAAGLVTSFARNNLSARTSAAEQWYRATVTFVWAK